VPLAVVEAWRLSALPVFSSVGENILRRLAGSMSCPFVERVPWRCAKGRSKDYVGLLGGAMPEVGCTLLAMEDWERVKCQRVTLPL